jgi:hypothetical protein
VTRLSLALILAAFWAVGLDASAVLVIQRADRVILATDAMRQRMYPDDRIERTSICKILIAGKWAIAPGGNSGDIPHQAFADMLRGAGSFDTVRTIMRGAMATRLVAALEHQRATVPASYRMHQAGDSISNVVVVGWDEGPRLGLLRLTLEAEAPYIRVQWDESSAPMFYFGSVESPVTRLMEVGTRPKWAEVATASVARQIIGMQIDAMPKDVAGPVDTIEVTAGGPRWVDRDPKSKCAN